MLPASADVEREAFQKRNLEQRITHTHTHACARASASCTHTHVQGIAHRRVQRIAHPHTQAIGASAAFQESPPWEQKDQLLGQWTLVQGYLLR